MIRFSKWKNSSTKRQSPWSIVELNRTIILPLPDDMICPSVAITCSDSRILCQFIETLLSLFHSPRHDSRRRSRLMLVLSHSDTHHLNRHMIGCGCHDRSEQSCSSQRYMAWCGCHEILIALCYSEEVFCPDQEKSQLNRNVPSGWKEKSSEMAIKYELESKK